MATFFGYVSAALWVLSSLAWIWSAATPAPVRRNPQSAPGFEGLEIITGPEHGGLFINGMRPPTADEFFAYQRTLFVRSAIAALFAVLATSLASFSSERAVCCTAEEYILRIPPWVAEVWHDHEHGAAVHAVGADRWSRVIAPPTLVRAPKPELIAVP